MRFVMATILFGFMMFISVICLVIYGMVTENLKPPLDELAEDEGIGGKYHGVMDSLWIVGWVACLLTGPVAGIVIYLVSSHWEEAEQYETSNRYNNY